MLEGAGMTSVPVKDIVILGSRRPIDPAMQRIGDMIVY